MTTIFVSSGHTSSGLTIDNGNTLEILSGGTAEFITVSSGGIQQVDAGGFASQTVVYGGGSDTVLGFDRQAEVQGGGTVVVSGGGQTVWAVLSGGVTGIATEIVSSGGTAWGTTISSNGFEIVSSGGTDVYAQVHSGGDIDLAGGASYYATLTGVSGTLSGIERVNSGVAYETYVSSGGKLFVSGSNASAVNVLEQGGGGIVISSGAFVSGLDMTGGFTNLRGGTIIGALVTTGANLNISGGTASAIIVEGNGTSSGTVHVSAGGTAAGLIIAGGVVEVLAGGIVGGAIQFAGAGGTLKLDTTTTGTVLSNTISGFESGNSIDLANVAFSAGATATLLSGDVLELTDGGKKYDFQLSTSQNFSGETFSAASDGASGTQITTNQPIQISGATIGSVQKDTFLTASGTLTATDSAGGGVTWTVAGGTTPHAPNYAFAIDQFQVIKNGAVEFNDDFNSLTPPNFSDGQTGQYTVVGGTLANNGSQDQLLGSNAGPLNATTNGQIAYLDSDTSPGTPSDGLFSGTSFTVKGTFDLVIPTDPRSVYGIQLTDRNVSDGHDSVRLLVTRNIYNQVLVQLQEFNSTTGTTDFLQSIALAPAAGDNRIELDLSNNGAVNNGSIAASFSLLNGSTVDSTTNFTQNGLVFVPENGVAEDWTQASFVAWAPAVSDSIATGTYGTLDIEQNGTWGYGLNNSLPAVQALTQQQFVSESFQVQAADSHGNSTTTPITAIVAGDSPTLSVSIFSGLGQGAAINGANGFNQFLAFGDSGIDSGYFLTHPFSNNATIQNQYDLSKAAGGGIPTTLGGTMNSVLLAQDFGLTAIPLGEAGGTNYAASGATVRNSLSGSLAPNINSQVQSYLSSNGTANPNALYLVDGGGNDEKIADQLLPAAAQTYMVESANQLAADIEQLHAAGAQYILIKGLGAGGSNGSLGALFSYTVQQDLAAAGVPFVLEDTSTLIRAIDANPAAYGITNIFAPPAGPFTASPYNPVEGGADLNPDPTIYSKGWSLEATQLSSPNAGQTDLWSDDEHLSAVGQALEANYMYELVQNAIPTVGETLTANPTLVGSDGSTSNIVYQWQRELAGQNWGNIGGANGSTYVVQAGDLGANLRVVASFTDPDTGQLVTANSAATFAVVAAPATWVPGVSGDWSTAADWTANAVPAPTDNVVLDNLTTSPNTITITVSSSQSAESLTLNDTGTTVVESGGTLMLAGALTIDAGKFVLHGGGVNAAGGIFVEAALLGATTGGKLQVKDGSILSGSVVDNGVVDYAISGTNSFSGTLSGRGTLVVEGGGHLVLNGTDTYSGGTFVSASTLELATPSAAGTGTITLASGGHATLQIDGNLPADMPANSVAGFLPTDLIHLANVAFDSAGSAVMGANNQLQITEGGNTYDLQLDPNQDFSGDTFHLVEATDHSTLVTEIACYCRGTLIRTKTGDVPVEALAIGDRLVTASGAVRPIKWIGRRSYGGRFVQGRKDVLPVCFKAGSLGDGLPQRDLWISPHHAMYLDGVLVEARDLVNGVSVVQVEHMEQVEYFHVELETHDVISAEGAWSETFVDDDSRGMFHNADEYAELYPKDVRHDARYCAPRLDAGHKVEAIRRRIAERAGLACASPTVGALRGALDRVSARTAVGWAQNPDQPETPVCLDIYLDDALIGQTLANHYRGDLEQAGLGTGRHAFEFTAPDGVTLLPAKLTVRRSLDGAILAQAPTSRSVMAAAA